jgi:uncharacterized protein
MAAGSPDTVDCARLSMDSAVLERVYELSDLPRLKDLVAEPQGTLHATFAFSTLSSGRPGAVVTVEATPRVICQRCMQGIDLAVTGSSEVEFAADEADTANSADSEREFYRMENGHVSLRELAEEELLLALPIAPACDTPLTCGRAPSYVTGDEMPDVVGDMRRPFSALQDLLKKT